MTSTHPKTSYVLEGILLLILGAVAIWVPTETTLSLTFILGILFIVAGVVQLVRILFNREHPSVWTAIFSAIIALLIGVLLLVFPLNAAMALALFLGIWFLVHGVLQIGMAVQLRNVSFNWGILLLSGIVSIILAIIIWSGWPWSALWVIGVLLGINLIFFGISLIALAFRHR